MGNMQIRQKSSRKTRRKGEKNAAVSREISNGDNYHDTPSNATVFSILTKQCYLLTSFSISARSNPPRLLFNDTLETRLVAVKDGVAGVKATAVEAKAPSAMTEVFLICMLEYCSLL